MRVLLVGSNEGGALELIYIKYLRELISDVELFSLNDHYFKGRSLFTRIINRVCKLLIYYKIKKNLIKTIETYNPDIVWIFKGVEIYPETLKKIKKISKAKLVNYNPDHPFIRVFRASGGKNVEDCVPFYDLHFCYSLDLSKEIIDKFKIPTVRLPFGFELDEKTYNRVEEQEEIKKVAFVGTPDNDRKNVIELLIKNKIYIDVYGYGWNKWLKENEYSTIFNEVEKEDFWRTLRKYRVQLNIFRLQNTGSHNMRTFEIPAVGGIELAPYSKEHSSFFEDGNEIFLYRNSEELIENINLLLSASDQTVRNIRDACRKRSIENKYSYKHRTQIVYNEFVKLV